AEHWSNDPPLPPPAPAIPQAMVLTPVDITILTVLPRNGEARMYAEIEQEAHRVVLQKRRAREATRLVFVSETALRERVPVLLEAELVARPVGQKGRPSARKGIGITSKGSETLASTAG